MEIKEKITQQISKERHDINDLLTVMQILRSEQGCAWDREQTHKSIRRNFIEETYEVVEAIDTDNMELLREELGDVLFQVVFHAQMASEKGYFTFDDVANDVCEKMIVRHPHVFADTVANTPDKVIENWDKIKMQTKEQKTPSEVMESVSASMPSLMRATKLASKKQKYGLEERSAEEVVGDLLREIAVLCDSCNIDPEKALYDSCNRMIKQVKEGEDCEA